MAPVPAKIDYSQGTRLNDTQVPLRLSTGNGSLLTGEMLDKPQSHASKRNSSRDERQQSALLASRALELDDSNARALAVYGHLKSFLHHDYDAGLGILERALKACPNEPFCWALSSASMSYVGHSDCAVANAEHALRLSPLDRFRFYYVAALALGHYTAGRYESAAQWGRISFLENPLFTPNLRYLSAALVAASHPKEARRTVGKLLELQPDFTLKRYNEGMLLLKFDAARALHLEHLRKAGVPNGQ